MTAKGSVVIDDSQVWKSTTRSLPGSWAGQISWRLACKGPLASLPLTTEVLLNKDNLMKADLDQFKINQRKTKKSDAECLNSMGRDHSH